MEHNKGFFWVWYKLETDEHPEGFLGTLNIPNKEQTEETHPYALCSLKMSGHLKDRLASLSSEITAKKWYIQQFQTLFKQSQKGYKRPSTLRLTFAAFYIYYMIPMSQIKYESYTGGWRWM